MDGGDPFIKRTCDFTKILKSLYQQTISYSLETIYGH